MDQEQIPKSSLQASQIHEESLLRSQNMGDLEISRNLQQVEALPDCYLAGLDATHGIGWMFLPTCVFLYRHNEVSFQKYYLSYLDLSRHAPVCKTRPAFFLIAGQYFAVFTNGTELIAASVFGIVATKAKHRFEQFHEAERVLQFSHSVRDEHGADHFALCTSNKQLYVVRLCSGGGGVRIEARRLEDPASRGLVSAVRGLLGSFLPKAKAEEIAMSKLVFRVRDANYFSLTVFASTDLERAPVRSEFFTLLISRQSLEVVKKLAFHPAKRLSHVLDVEVDLNYHYFLAETEERQVCLLVSKHDGRVESQLQDIAVLDRDDESDSRSYGRLFKCGPDLWVILRLGERYRVLRGSEDSLAEFASEKVSHPVVGATVAPDQSLLVFTNHDVLRSIPEAEVGTSQSRQGAGLSRMDEEGPLCESSFVLQVDSRRLEDLIRNGFNQYYVERTTGFIQEGLRVGPGALGAASLGEIVARNVRVFSEEVSPNLTLFELVSAKAALEARTKDLVLFDLEQRLQKIGKFREFLQKNKLFEQLAPREALSFLQAEEALSALTVFRSTELKLHRSESGLRLLPLFLEAFRAAVGDARGPGSETVRFYSKPLSCWRALEHLLVAAAGVGAQQLVVGLLTELLQRLEAARDRWAAHEPAFEVGALPADWWLHKDALLLSALPDFFRQLAADTPGIEGLAVALVREVERVARGAADPGLFAGFLQSLYGWLLANRRQSVAYQEASAAKNEHMLAQILIRHNLDLTLMNFIDKLSQASKSLLAKIIDVAVEQVQSAADDASCTNALRVFSIEQIAPRVRLHVQTFHPNLLWLLLLSQKNKARDASKCMDTVNELDFLQLSFASLLEPLGHSATQITQENLDWSYLEGLFAQNGLKCPKDKTEFIFDCPDLPEDRKLVQVIKLGAMFSESAESRRKLEELGKRASDVQQFLTPAESSRLAGNFRDKRKRQNGLEYLLKPLLDKQPD